MSNKKTCGIYKITNTLTNEAYIGQSKNIEKRIATHKEDLENGTHVNKGLQEDYDLAKSLNPDYEIFTFKIIKEVKAKDLNKEEMYWINEFNSFERGYNKTSGGSHDETKGHVDYGGGRLFTDEKRIKLMTKELTDDFANKENYIFKTTSNEVLCSKCGKEFNDEFDFCPFCGTRKPQPKICPKCKLEPSIEFSFCPKCGIELVDKAEYLEKIEKKKQEELERIELEKKYKKLDELEEEWDKGEEINELIQKGDEYLESYDLENALPYYNKTKEIFNSINQNIYNQELEIGSYTYKGYNFKFLKEDVEQTDEKIRSINDVFKYGKILEWGGDYNKTELNEIILNYHNGLKIPFEDIYCHMGCEHKNLKNWCTKWKNILEKAILNDPDNMNYWREKGIVLEFLEEDDQAIDCYKNALKINPNDKETNILLIERTMYFKGDEALEYCNNILKVYPSDIRLLKLKLEVLNKLRYGFKDCKIDEENILEYKLECYDRLLELGIKEIETYDYYEIIWISRLETLISLNKHEEIIECCDKLLTIGNYADDEEYWELKINALSELGRFEEALECQKTAVKYLKTLNEEPRSNERANTDEKIKSWEELLKYDELIKKEPNNKSYYLRKTALLKDLNRYKEAEASYKEYEKLLDEENKPKRTFNIGTGHKINSVVKEYSYNNYQFKICPNCKNQVDSNFKICPNCYHVFHD